MNPEDKEIRKRTLLIMVIIVVVIALIGVSYVVFHQRKQMDDMTELFAIEKEQLTDEYAELSLQYEGYKFSVGNDSLVALLTTEQMKVQRLMEELRTVKATNTRRITELKRELETLRKIMRGYVVQIDSLNAETVACATRTNASQSNTARPPRPRRSLRARKSTSPSASP